MRKQSTDWTKVVSYLFCSVISCYSHILQFNDYFLGWNRTDSALLITGLCMVVWVVDLHALSSIAALGAACALILKINNLGECSLSGIAEMQQAGAT